MTQTTTAVVVSTVVLIALGLSTAMKPRKFLYAHSDPTGVVHYDQPYRVGGGILSIATYNSGEKPISCSLRTGDSVTILQLLGGEVRKFRYSGSGSSDITNCSSPY